MKTKINGEELRLIRTLRNARVIDVAIVIDRSASAVTYIEAGNRSLDDIQSQAVLKAFNVDEDLLSYIRKTIKLSKI
ncbi:helix-turn-helix domain-containing protein [Bacillus sp. V3B]|uniref:helix-turn-helix domain-containing protein n=1 Tax=Bacillus sp. V3B TaxID=2804915 RepID=UPI00210D4879|nr:helix-turn-helix domain-containing protein [Bacillus sp. V3B]MCQ6277308.1 helix-turn-helix domain-containing protein [Bacillus sp. V3B]